VNTCQTAEQKNQAPNPMRTATQKKVIILCTRGVQNLRDLKTRRATPVYQIKSNDQCNPAKTKNPGKRKILAFKINVVPMVSHHKIKAGLAAVVFTPAKNDSCLEPSKIVSALFLFSNVETPIQIINAPPIRPIPVCMNQGTSNSLSKKKIRNITGNSTTPCPSAMRNPAFFLLADFSSVTANSGPGKSTPEREINATKSKNEGKSVIKLHVLEVEIAGSNKHKKFA
jgi:hypothetical protein